MSLLIEPQYSALQDISRDSLFEGELVCFQSRKGYRFSIDAVLVAHFVDVRQNERILDLGTGSGIISMILLYRWRDRLQKVSGIEVQQGLAELARKNLKTNNFGERGEIIEGDIKNINTLIEPESYDKVVCNPPFYIPTSGRTSKNVQSQLARHQILGTLRDFLEASFFAVKNGGLVTFIYPAERIGDFFSLAKESHFEVKRVQFVYSYPHKTAAARLVLIQCAKNGGPGSEILPPFYIYCQKNGAYSPEMQDLYTKNQEAMSRYDN
jgi:tRNA1Val (adenine37-N6)-methyltransferase